MNWIRDFSVPTPNLFTNESDGSSVTVELGAKMYVDSFINKLQQLVHSPLVGKSVFVQDENCILWSLAVV